MKTRTITALQSKNSIRIVLIAALVLLLPLVAMQFTDEVAWDLTDFVVAGSLVLGTGFMYELAVKKIRNTSRRTAIGIALLIAFLLIWAELAVGIFGTPFGG